MALQKRLQTAKGKEITVKFENKRYWVKHTEMSQQFVTVDVALDNWFLNKEEKEFIEKAIDELG